MTDQVWKHTPDMGEISGFGGSYEAACQQMLHQGVEYLIHLGEREPDFDVNTYPGIFGIAELTGSDAEGLDAAVCADVDPSGAMHHAVVLRLRFIAKNGWNSYCQELRESHRAAGHD
jgi:hypothetical protein